jgi:hypothetical protein
MMTERIAELLSEADGLVDLIEWEAGENDRCTPVLDHTASLREILERIKAELTDR